MRISSLNWSCLKVRCLGRDSYLNVVNQCCFRPQRIAGLASSCCSHAEDLATWPRSLSARDCVSDGSQCEQSFMDDTLRIISVVFASGQRPVGAQGPGHPDGDSCAFAELPCCRQRVV